MTGRDWKQELSAYIDGELEPGSVAALEAELSHNPALKALEQQLRKTVALMPALPSPSASTSLRRSVLASAGKETFAERLRSMLKIRLLAPAALVAAAGVAAFVGLRPGGEVRLVENEEQLLLAQTFEVVEDLDLAGLERADDFEVVAQLHETNEVKSP